MSRTGTSKSTKTGIWFFVIQRLTAIILGVFTLVLIVFFVLHTDWGTESSDNLVISIKVSLSYQEWQTFFSSMFMQLLYALSLISLAAHAWIGLWTIVTDYIRTTVFGKGTEVFRKLILAILALILILYVYLGLSVF